MKNIYVVESLRTPQGSFGGVLADVAAPVLAATVIKEIVERTKIEAKIIDEVIIGQVLSGGAGQAPARQAMRLASLPDSIPAMTINKVCGSGLKALMLGAGSIRLGDASVVIAGGMENMSQAPYLLQQARYGYRMGNGKVIDMMIHDGLQDPYSDQHMGVIAEASVGKQKLSREEQDQSTLRSYRRSQAATKEGIFSDEIVPVVKKTRKGETVVTEDEEPFNVDFEKLLKLRPVFKKDGTITAGNASTISDGAAITLLASEEAVEKYGLKPKARLAAYASNSMHPDDFALAPIGAIEKVCVKGAIEKVCVKAGLSISDIDLFEINEAFAAVPLFAIEQLRLDPEKVNVNGGAVSVGHPLGASGARLATTLIREMQKRKVRYGLATLCIGGGEAVAVIFGDCCHD